MKIYISADIEGVTGITHWDETNKGKADYTYFQKQMSKEVAAACEGALEAGATEILLKDAHWTGRNIITSELPEEVKIIRGWSGHPFSMVQELDESADAVLFTGYHSHVGSNTNPLSHTINTENTAVTINGQPASEFLMHSYIAAMQGVPVVFLAGDAGLCRDVKALNEHIETVAVNTGIGDSTISIHPALAVKQIKEGVARALQRDLAACQIVLPEHFSVEITYKGHTKASKASFYPGAQSIAPHTVRFDSDDYFEVLRFFLFVL
ncbi:MAG: amino acid amidase [bacterium]|nr:amino acid amidase [bacterium]